MFQTEKKLAARLTELDSHRYRGNVEISSFQFQLDAKGEVGTKPPIDGEWTTLKKGETWTGRDLYAWLAAEVKIPVEWDSKEVVGVFDFGITDGGTNSGFESLLYVNHVPYQGVDGNHKEVFFSNELTGDAVQLDFRLWSGLEGGGRPVEQVHTFKQAFLAWLDENVDDLYYTGKAALQTVEMLDKTNPVREDLLLVLNRAFNQIDWMSPGSDEFYQSIKAARESLKNGLDQMEKHHPVTVHAIGHTHIDLAWLWRLEHTREKEARSFSTVLRLMEKYPEYLFQQAQPQLYEYIKQDYPVLYEQIHKRVEEGRWEPEGGMWVEPDCNLPSGESFIRQLLHGTRFFRKEFGVECTYLWLPDVFGYSWALPQILMKSGITSFVTTKISWNQYNRMPHDVFTWRGIDGTEILTYFITTPYPGRKGWGADYNADISAETMIGAWEAFRDKGVTKDVMVTYGHGDGGGGVTRDMLEMRRRLDAMPGAPNVVTGKAGDYLEKLHKDVKETDGYVHLWDGELYLEFHRGTYTSQAYNKKSNRKLELLYKEVELLSVLEGVLTNTWKQYPQELLNKGWKIILRNQFHDILPGSSIKEVYEDSKLEYREAEEIALSIRGQAGKGVVSKDKTQSYTILNQSSWQRNSLIEIPVHSGMESGSWFDHSKNLLHAEKVGDHWLVDVSVPSLGFTTIDFVPNQQDELEERQCPFAVEDNRLTTPYYEMKWNESGHLTRIFDRRNNRDVLGENQAGNVLQIFEDKPTRWDAWEIDISYQEKMKEIRNVKSIEVIEVNAHRAVIQFTWQYNQSVIEQKMIVYAGKPRIDFETSVKWHEVNQLLKVAFPVNVRSTEATFDIQFGNVKRPTHWNTSWDLAKFETVGHQWADLSERGYGVSLLNDCKYGYDIKDATMRLTLLKGATYPDYTQDQGEQTFTYSLLPHKGSWVEGETVQEAADLNQPLSYIQGKSSDSSFSLFSVSADYTVVDAVKKAEDSDKVVIRLHEFTGGRGPVSVTSELSIKSWQECNLMEEPVGERSHDDTIEFDIKPYEIKTFLVEIDKQE
ncbi:alpha-mannosidase [Virgibacillus oceani]|uniref:Alpha-mannosidase n=1 Tax=Virgibacillus oceani TaxID=1479511 RepID=A0A917HKT4_9BACI|nr:alpha-mannosidase [Virgibacillus oceani]GGG82731.1 alpha-mannosidase [Virgibacillus oceani]